MLAHRTAFRSPTYWPRQMTSTGTLGRITDIPEGVAVAQSRRVICERIAGAKLRMTVGKRDRHFSTRLGSGPGTFEASVTHIGKLTRRAAINSRAIILQRGSCAEALTLGVPVLADNVRCK